MRFYLGRELHDTGRDREAAEQLEIFLRNRTPGSKTALTPCLTLSACYQALGQTERILPALLQSLEWDTPGQRSAVRRAPTFSSSSGLNRPFSGVIWQRTARRNTGGFFFPRLLRLSALHAAVRMLRPSGQHPMAEICNEKAAACKPDDEGGRLPLPDFARWHLEREATPAPSD